MELKNIIKGINVGDSNNIEEVILRFEPLIGKYSRKIDGDDTKQELILYLIELINKISVNIDDFPEDKYIISYISTSIRNKYIKLSKLNSLRLKNEFSFDSDIDIKSIWNVDNYHYELIEDKNLTINEKKILIYIFYKGLSVTDIAKIMSISRQAVNQTKVRALKKIKKNYKLY